MDANEKDPAELRRREERLARRVGEALDRLDSRAESECPDAEVIAAYSERALAPGESAQWENHFATCARCRTVLRVLAASGEAPLADAEITRLGEVVSSARASAEAKKEVSPPVRRKTPDWRIRWFAPAFGVAAVLAVWFALRPRWRELHQVAKPALLAEATKTQPPLPPSSSDQLARVVPQSSQETRNRDARNGPNANAREKAAPLPAASPPPAIPPPKAKAEEAQSALQSAIRPEADTAARNALAEATPNAVADNRGAQDKKSTARQGMGGGLSAPQPSPQVAMDAERRDSAAVLKATGPTLITATSPFGSTIWRAGTGGRIEFSADAGESWTAQLSPAHEDWLAGSAVSDAVCWFAGRNGAIARTTDGEHWALVTPPVQAAGVGGKVPDWIGITARGPLSATITAADGRRFATSDGGAKWQALLPGGQTQ